VAGEHCERVHVSHRRVTFDKKEVFSDADETVTAVINPSEEVINTPDKTVNYKWGRDGVDFPYPATEHRERVTWRPAPSRRHINPTEGRYRESYDLDLLPFQAGSYASDKEETDYLEADIDGRLFKGIQLTTPEKDYDTGETTDDMPGQAHTTSQVDAQGLANEPDETESTTQPQAALDNCELTCEIEAAPEIDIEFGDEPSIELSSYY